MNRNLCTPYHPPKSSPNGYLMRSWSSSKAAVSSSSSNKPRIISEAQAQSQTADCNLLLVPVLITLMEASPTWQRRIAYRLRGD